MTNEQIRLSELHGELNQLQSTTAWLSAQGKLIIAQIDEIERSMQTAPPLTVEQQAILDRDCVECET